MTSTREQKVACARSPKWTPQEDAILIEAYKDSTQEELGNLLPGRSTASCLLRGARLGLTRPAKSPQGDIAALLREDPIAAYWMGYVMADGSFGGTYFTRLQMTTMDIDRLHLEQFASWLSPGIQVRDSVNQLGNTVVSFGIQDRINSPLIQAKFDLKPRKTYNPPSHIPYEDDILLRAWLIGFIDGDGNISYQSGRKTVRLGTVAHISWLSFLEEVSSRLDFGKVTTRKGGDRTNTNTYVGIFSHAFPEIVRLKQFGSEHGLPMLARKWDRIDETLVIRGGKRAQVEKLIPTGMTNTEIANMVTCSPSYVSTLRSAMLLT